MSENIKEKYLYHLTEIERLKGEILNKLSTSGDVELLNLAYWETDIPFIELVEVTRMSKNDIMSTLDKKEIKCNCVSCNKELELKFRRSQYQAYLNEINASYPTKRPWNLIRLCKTCSDRILKHHKKLWKLYDR